MSLSSGTRLGVYEVSALIGEGGIGQVYQATDTKLHRDVALKILPEAPLPERFEVRRRPKNSAAELGGIRCLAM